MFCLTWKKNSVKMIYESYILQYVISIFNYYYHPTRQPAKKMPHYSFCFQNDNRFIHSDIIHSVFSMITEWISEWKQNTKSKKLYAMVPRERHEEAPCCCCVTWCWSSGDFIQKEPFCMCCSWIRVVQLQGSDVIAFFIKHLHTAEHSATLAPIHHCLNFLLH